MQLKYKKTKKEYSNMKKSLSFAFLSLASMLILSEKVQAEYLPCTCEGGKTFTISVPVQKGVYPVTSSVQQFLKTTRGPVMNAFAQCIITCHNIHGKSSGTFDVGFAGGHKYRLKGTATDIQGPDDYEYVVNGTYSQL